MTIVNTTQSVGLTSCEREALAFIGIGRTHKQVADILCKSFRTVDDHLQNAYRKLDAHNRVQALRRAMAQGHLTQYDLNDARERLAQYNIEQQHLTSD